MLAFDREEPLLPWNWGMNNLLSLKDKTFDLMDVMGGTYCFNDLVITILFINDLNADGAAFVALSSDKHPSILLTGHPNFEILPLGRCEFRGYR